MMMQTIKKIIVGTLLTLVLAIGFSTPDAKALDACADFAGTYVLNTSYPSTASQDFAGKRVITLTKDGQFFSIDSNEGGTFGVPPAAQDFPNNRFTGGQGIWQCVNTNPVYVVAKAFNFNFPDPTIPGGKVTIAKADYNIYQLRTNDVIGSFAISTEPLESTLANQPTKDPYTFYFTGKKQSLLSK